MTLEVRRKIEESLDALHADLEAICKDAERFRALKKHGALGFSGALAWKATLSIPTYDAVDETLEQLSDRLIEENG